MAEETYHMEVAITPAKTVTLYTDDTLPADADGLPTFTHDNEAEPRTHTLWNHVEVELIKMGHIDPSNFKLIYGEAEEPEVPEEE